MSDLIKDDKRSWEKMLLFLFPSLLLEGTPWRDLWAQEERALLKRRFRAVGLLVGIGYILHYFVVDIPAKVTPLHTWMIYRFVIAGGYFLTFVHASSRHFDRTRSYRIPMLVMVIVSSYLFSHSILWDARMPYFFSFVLPIFFVWFLYLSLPASLCLLGSIYFLQAPILHHVLIQYSEGDQKIASGFIAGLVLIGVIRSSLFRDIQSFIQKQRLLEEQLKVIQINSQLVEQTKSFVPREIFNRILSIQRQGGVSIVQATNEVLLPRRTFVTCLYSDIRNYTTASSDAGYLRDAAIPNIQTVTDSVENHRGIPKLIGDLIFAYFDFGEERLSLIQSLQCAAEISLLNRRLNLQSSKTIKRFIILSAGEATVGNIGGSGSAREITCLGNPANIVQRIDELTKSAAFSEQVKDTTLILTSLFAEKTKNQIPGLTMDKLHLAPLSLNIRSFPDEKTVFLFEINPVNLEILDSADGSEAPETTKEREELKWTA